MESGGTDGFDYNRRELGAMVTASFVILLIAAAYMLTGDEDNELGVLASLLLGFALAVIGCAVYPGNYQYLAGYNSMSEEQLAKYDLTALCRRYGIGFTESGVAVVAVGVVCGAGGMDSLWIALVSVALFVLLIIAVWMRADRRARKG